MLHECDALIVSEKVGTQQQKNEICLIQTVMEDLQAINARLKVTHRPDGEYACLLKGAQVGFPSLQPLDIRWGTDGKKCNRVLLLH
jgi:hypothetical protein